LDQEKEQLRKKIVISKNDLGVKTHDRRGEGKTQVTEPKGEEVMLPSRQQKKRKGKREGGKTERVR